MSHPQNLQRNPRGQSQRMNSNVQMSQIASRFRWWGFTQAIFKVEGISTTSKEPIIEDSSSSSSSSSDSQSSNEEEVCLQEKTKELPPPPPKKKCRSQSRSHTPKQRDDRQSWSRSPRRDDRCRCHWQSRSSYSRSQGSTSYSRRSRRSLERQRITPQEGRVSILFSGQEVQIEIKIPG